MKESLERARAASEAGRYGEAAGICQDVLRSSPEHPYALGLLGTALAKTGEPWRGIELLQRAIKIEPDHPTWHVNLAAVYYDEIRSKDALECLQRAFELTPDDSHVCRNLALLYADFDDWERAKAVLLRAIGRSPDDADAHLGLGQVLLAQGEFAPGWIEYEWRNRMGDAGSSLPTFTSPQWNGMRIPTGRIVIVADQGFGDQIQFARYLPMVAERCKEVFVGCNPPISGLLARVSGVSGVLTAAAQTPPHAAYYRLTSLAGLFETREDTIPAEVPYIRPDLARVKVWSERLAERLPRKRFRVGLAWAGNPGHADNKRRCVPVGLLRPLLDVDGVDFIAIQKPSDDAPAGVMSLGAEIGDFDDTAALVANVDLVITVDTSLAHVAGAMGRPVWTMIYKAADWRWLLNREDSPWYPSMRLFRQQFPGDWDLVVPDVAAALRYELGRGG